MDNQARSRSASGQQRQQMMHAASYPLQTGMVPTGLGRHTSGPVPFAFSTTQALQPSTQAGVTNPNAFRDQQMSPSSSQGQLSPNRDSVSPGSMQAVRSTYAAAQLASQQSMQGLSGEYALTHAGGALADLSQDHQSFEAFLVDPSLQTNNHPPNPSVNPAELMSHMSSPFGGSVGSSNGRRMDRESSPHSQHPSPMDQLGVHSAQHSPRHSLNPASAAFPPGQSFADWTALEGAAFQTHRRTPSEHSEVSSVAPSPFLPSTDTFESMDAQRSPMLRSQPDTLFQEGLGIEHFTISDTGPNQGLSPVPSPHISPRLSPHSGLDMSQSGGFLLATDPGGTQFGGPMPSSDMYPQVKSERIPSVQLNNGSGELGGFAAHMATPEINIEYAAPSKLGQQNLEPPRSLDGCNALSPPERGRKGRIRAQSDPYVGGSPLPRSPSPRAAFPLESRRSLSPQAAILPTSSPGSSTKSSRRSSTSSIPNRDYILDLADPQRPGSGAADSKRVQKHPATFQCTLCPKRFTRAYNLRSHLRTHTDERPFVCTVCGKAFARQHDRKRHEGLHSGEKKFVCRGELKSGSSWGCGRRFARADALGRHFRSEAGRICIKPLLDEEAMQQGRQPHLGLGGTVNGGQLLSQPDDSMRHSMGGTSTLESMNLGMSDPSGGGGGGGAGGGNSYIPLPQALLAQYPALANLPWDSLGPGDDGAEAVSGRSSFDASSGGDYYDDDLDNSNGGGGYVSSGGGGGGGLNSGGVGNPPALERWASSEGWVSDYGVGNRGGR